MPRAMLNKNAKVTRGTRRNDCSNGPHHYFSTSMEPRPRYESSEVSTRRKGPSCSYGEW